MVAYFVCFNYDQFNKDNLYSTASGGILEKVRHLRWEGDIIVTENRKATHQSQLLHTPTLTT